jgi:protein-disulfide isomerase
MAACGRDSAPANAQTAQTDGDRDYPAVLATIGDEKITMEDVLAHRSDDLAQLDIQYRRNRHAVIQNTLQEIIRERILTAEAKRQGKSVEELIETAGGRSLNPTEAEVAAWYAQNQARLAGRTLEQVGPQIAEYLRTQRREIAVAALEGRLNREGKLVVHLQPFRIQFDNAGAPAVGPADAPVTLVEFADFQCPYCSKFSADLKRIQQQFGDQLLIVYRHFPITSIHPHAFKAAEASVCAEEQGKFWELHDLMYLEQSRLAVNDLKEKARRLGLDSSAFDRCIDSGKHAERVQSDYQAGIRAGVTGTPALFINGEPLAGGAVAAEAIAAAIDTELARLKQ